MVIRALLWDFGDTLADERWMSQPMAGVPDWPQAYKRFSEAGELAMLWNLGAIRLDDVADAFGRELQVSSSKIKSHMEECSRKISFYSRIRAFTAVHMLPQTIVTVNPDIFSDIVVPTYGLDQDFDVIVTSWQQGSVDKGELCDVARSKINLSLDPSECLLIDNKEECVRLWRERGGASYLFKDEASFLDEKIGP